MIDRHSDRDYYQNSASSRPVASGYGFPWSHYRLRRVRNGCPMRYTEAVSTMSAEILVGLPERPDLNFLKPIYNYCLARGYHAEGEAARVDNWPVQFIPAFSPITEEAMREAEVAEIEGVPLREWQRNRAALSWEEKLKMSLIMRETQRDLRVGDGPRRDPQEKPTNTPQDERVEAAIGPRLSL
jgi:hypothetical protein